MATYRKYKAAQQPDQMACWSTTMAWWTRTVKSVPNQREVDILGLYPHLTASDGGLRFPGGFKSMLEDARWGLTVVEMYMGMSHAEVLVNGDKKGPILFAYWDNNVGGYHAVALYGWDGATKMIWAMDPAIGMHIQRDIWYYVSAAHSTSIAGYLASK